MADAAGFAPTDGDPEITSPEAESSEGATELSNPFNVDEDATEADVIAPEGDGTAPGTGTDSSEDVLDNVDDFSSDLSGDDAVHSWDVDPDGVLYSPVDPTYTIGAETETGLTADEVDPLDVFSREIDPEDNMDEEVPLPSDADDLDTYGSSDDLGADGMFGSSLDGHDLMDTGSAPLEGEAGCEPDSFDAGTGGS